jgi:hypothetical protein
MTLIELIDKHCFLFCLTAVLCFVFLPPFVSVRHLGHRLRQPKEKKSEETP